MTPNPAEFLAEDLNAEPTDGPFRRCAATGESRDKAGLIRFALDPQGCPIPDIDETLPGRGFWVTAARGVVSGKSARKRLARMLGGQGLPDDIDDRIERLLLSRCLDMIGLARRAGQAVAGWEKVRSAAARQPIGVLLTASDAGSDGWRRMRALAADCRHSECLAGGEIGQPFGRGSTVHAALLPGRLADRLFRETGRLAGFRQSGGDHAPDLRSGQSGAETGRASTPRRGQNSTESAKRAGTDRIDKRPQAMGHVATT